MRIIKIDIVQFGKFSDFSLDFAEGFNIVEGKNESGKSTIQAFIKFVLYGLPRRNPNVAIGERERALSWLGGVAKGSVTLEYCGKSYRVEREEKSVGRGVCKTIDLQTGEFVFANEVPGEVFLGISMNAYDSMCNIRQLDCTTLDGGAIHELIENILTGGDAELSAEKALKALDKVRTTLIHKNGKGGRVYELEKECERLENELIKANANQEKILELSSDIDRKKLQVEKRREEYIIAQNKCDLYDGVGKLEEFRELAELKARAKEIQEKTDALESDFKLYAELPSEDSVREAERLSQNLSAQSSQLIKAETDYSEARERFNKSAEGGFVSNEGFSELLEEFSSPESLVAHIKNKKKKIASASLTFGLFLGIALGLFAFGVALAVLKQLFLGAITLLSIGAVMLFISVLSLFKKQSARRDLNEVISRLGEGFSEKGTDKIFEIISDFSARSYEINESSQELRSAEARLGIVRENKEEVLSSAKALVKSLFLGEEGDTAEVLAEYASRANIYFSAHKELETEKNQLAEIIKRSASRLEKYSESDLKRRITPEIEAELKKATPELLKRKRDELDHKLRQLSSNIAERERELSFYEGSGKNPDTLARELYSARTEKEREEGRLNAIKLAYSTLEGASDNLKAQITPRICAGTGELMSKMTNGKYSELYLNDKMEITLLADGETRPIEALSKGSCDLAYFAVRLSLVSVMCAGKDAPLIMDETFALLDSTRETEALRALYELVQNRQQAILFTCRSIDRELAKGIFGKDMNVIQL